MIHNSIILFSYKNVFKCNYLKKKMNKKNVKKNVRFFFYSKKIKNLGGVTFFFLFVKVSKISIKKNFFFLNFILILIFLRNE